MENNSTVYYFNKNTNTYFNLFWIGFVIYTLAYDLSTTTIYYYFDNIIQFLALGLIVFSSSQLIKFNISNKYLKYVYVIYCAWLLITILRSFLFKYDYIKYLLFDGEFGVMPYFIPLILLFPQNIFFYKKTFKVITVFAALFIVYNIIFIRNILNINDYNNNVVTKYTFDHFAKSLAVPSGFLILTYSYQTQRVKLFYFLVLGITLFLAMHRARRAILFMSICPVIVAGAIYSILTRRTFQLIAIGSIVVIAIVVTLVNRNPANNIGPFKLLNERVNEDSRTPVEICFYNDMALKDWIIGKGLDGQYYCPNIDIGDKDVGGKLGYRTIIETDYLNIILKAGILGILLLLLITVPAIVKGLFFSRNLLSKAAAIWILLWIIDLYPATVNTFSMDYALVWMSVAICYNDAIRKLPEPALQLYFERINNIVTKKK